MPGMLRNVPKWLAQPDGPLSVPPSYAPRALPWLMKWVAAGRNLDVVRRSSSAMRALHRDAFDRYRELLGADAFRDLFRQSGLVQVWSTAGVSRAEELARDLNLEAGVETQDLGPDDLRQMFPGIAGAVRGLLFPRNGHTVSPARITSTLADLLRMEGGEFRRERVLKLIPREGGGWTLMTNLSNHDAEAVVVAAGSWSARLVAHP
jgi:D-amino-acid dehydrogenase